MSIITPIRNYLEKQLLIIDDEIKEIIKSMNEQPILSIVLTDDLRDARMILYYMQRLLRELKEEEA